VVNGNDDESTAQLGFRDFHKRILDRCATCHLNLAAMLSEGMKIGIAHLQLVPLLTLS
jgi:hypothetical protein